MTNPDISILIPSIRTHLLYEVYSTIAQSCKRYSWELVLVSPFDLPAELAPFDNVKLIKSYRSPSGCAQMGVEHCSGKYLLHSVDDSRWASDAVDMAMDMLLSKKDRKATINMRYAEDNNYSGQEFEKIYWNSWHHPALRLAGIPSHYEFACHFLMDIEYFREIGGFSCDTEYQNFNLHDLMFRIQYDGGTVYQSAKQVTSCNHQSGFGDHVIIEQAWHPDYAWFCAKYNNPNALNPDTIKIPLDNWKNHPEIWSRRFPKLYKSYQEMMQG